MDQEQEVLEAAMCVMSEMENANFIGQLFGVEDEILHELAQYPVQADTFIRLALNFQGIITQSPLNPAPNRWRAAPGRCHPQAAFLQCQAGNHRECNHALTTQQYQTLQAEAITHHTSAIEIEQWLTDDVQQHGHKTRAPSSTACSTKKRCFKCNQYGHIHLQCPTNRRSWH